MFSKGYFLRVVKSCDCVVKSLPITTQCRILRHKTYIAVENIVRNVEIASNKQFLLFSQCFLPCNLFQFDQSKILSSGDGLIDNKMPLYLVNFLSGLQCYQQVYHLYHSQSYLTQGLRVFVAICHRIILVPVG